MENREEDIHVDIEAQRGKYPVVGVAQQQCTKVQCQVLTSFIFFVTDLDMSIAYWNIVLEGRFKFLDIWCEFLLVS